MTDDLIDTLRVTAQARRSAPAVEASDGTLTYAEIERLSAQLAHQLLAMGAAPGSRVGISMPRGARELVAMLAVLKAGAAYVPLDPSHPAERLGLIMADAAPEVLLVHPGSRLAEDSNCRQIVLDRLETLGIGWPSAPLPTATDALAYVMFTSGSTGRPKGVEIPRRALANFLRSMAHTPGLTADDRLLAVTTTAFDIAGLELYLPLWVGATVVIVDSDVARDPQRLARRLAAGDITTMQATPATWRLLLEAGWTGDPRLRILCGGEAMSAALADSLLAAGRELWNLYGPTETTIWSAVQRIEPGYDRVTIGRPIDRTTLHVLDDASAPVAPGVEGELAIGGDGLARGYWGRPDLTAKAFIEGPDGQRLYRTGDLARQLPDGRFECLGRLDHQIKIDGFRVELGEIESRLQAVSGVRDVLVVARQPAQGPARLVAYWVGTAPRDALRDAARRWLPPYMVPSGWVPLERFPLSPNGKIDRHRLPSPQASAARGPEPATPSGLRPQSDTEARIAAVWREVLELPDVAADRDFFEHLGGNSVLAARVVTLLRQQTGTEIPLQALYEAPTIERLAARLAQDLPHDRSIIVRLRAGDRSRPPLFCLLGVHLYQDLALALAGSRPVVGIHVPFRCVPGQPRPSLGEIAARYIGHIRKQQPVGPYRLLGLCYGGVVAYEVARQLEATGDVVELVVVIDAVLPTAIHSDPARRLRGYADAWVQSWRSPERFRTHLAEQRARLLARLPRRWRWSRGDTEPAAPADLPIDGPEVDAELRRFAADGGRLRSRLLVVRAASEPAPAWQRIDADLGWRDRAQHVHVHDIEADHLGVLREPHVRSLARAMDRSARDRDRSSP